MEIKRAEEIFDEWIGSQDDGSSGVQINKSIIVIGLDRPDIIESLLSEFSKLLNI